MYEFIMSLWVFSLVLVLMDCIYFGGVVSACYMEMK